MLSEMTEMKMKHFVDEIDDKLRFFRRLIEISQKVFKVRISSSQT
jgi:hypothetical protein